MGFHGLEHTAVRDGRADGVADADRARDCAAAAAAGRLAPGAGRARRAHALARVGRGLAGPCRTARSAARSADYTPSFPLAHASVSTLTSGSRSPTQLATLRFVDPTRAQRPSATAVLACTIGPFHSNTRPPASSSG